LKIVKIMVYYDLHWVKISQFFPGVDPISIKNRYYSSIKKKELFDELLAEANKRRDLDFIDQQIKGAATSTTTAAKEEEDMFDMFEQKEANESKLASDDFKPSNANYNFDDDDNSWIDSIPEYNGEEEVSSKNVQYHTSQIIDFEGYFNKNMANSFDEINYNWEGDGKVIWNEEAYLWEGALLNVLNEQKSVPFFSYCIVGKVVSTT